MLCFYDHLAYPNTLASTNILLRIRIYTDFTHLLPCWSYLLLIEAIRPSRINSGKSMYDHVVAITL